MSASQPTSTSSGTPFSPLWDPLWCNFVGDAERALGRRICGARTGAGVPCEADPAHENGRCVNHGGVDSVGAARLNEYAVQYGLYMRRLRPCSETCPHWESCPMAQRSIPPGARSACAYELTEYEETVTRVAADLDIGPDEPAESSFETGMAWAAARGYAQARVMALRASTLLAKQDLVEVSPALTSKLSGFAQAYLRFDREQRNWQKELVAAARRLDERRKTVAKEQKTVQIDADYDARRAGVREYAEQNKRKLAVSLPAVVPQEAEKKHESPTENGKTEGKDIRNPGLIAGPRTMEGGTKENPSTITSTSTIGEKAAEEKNPMTSQEAMTKKERKRLAREMREMNRQAARYEKQAKSMERDLEFLRKTDQRSARSQISDSRFQKGMNTNMDKNLKTTTNAGTRTNPITSTITSTSTKQEGQARPMNILDRHAQEMQRRAQ